MIVLKRPGHVRSSSPFRGRRGLAIALCLSLALLLTPVTATLHAFSVMPATVFINEIHYDNTGTDTGEAIEIAGPAGTDLAGWSIVLYNGNGGAVYDTDLLSGVIPDQQNGFGTVSVGYSSNGIQNGSPDGIALVNPANSVIQFLSYEGSFVAVGGPASGLTSTDIGVAENGTEPVGLSLQLTGTGDVYQDFTWSAATDDSFSAVNTGQTFQSGPGDSAPTVSATTPADNASNVAANTNITITFSEPVNVSGNWFSITCTSGARTAAVSGGPTSFTLNPDSDFASGDSCSVAVVAALVSDQDSVDPPDTLAADYVFDFTVVAAPTIKTIGEVQGAVSDNAAGLTFRSPFAPPSGNGSSADFVTVQGVIYEKTLARTSSGNPQYGFFIQNTPATADGDPNTSDGIFVFMSGFTTLIGGYEPRIGDEVVIRARVAEFFNLTELTSASLVQLVRSGVDIDAELPAFEANPPDNLDDAYRYWERREGMRAKIAAGSIVVDSRDVFPSTADAEFWVINPNHPVAQRAAAYERRVFRDFHPLDNDPAHLFDDGNGYRIVLGSLGVKFTANNTQELLAPARVFDSLTNAPTGGVYFSFNKYQVMVAQQPTLRAGVDPSLNAPPQAFDRAKEFSIGPYNVENLYDFRDDPFDGCDFAGNSGCPGVSPPFDYVPASQAAYEQKLVDLADQIINDLKGPDILIIQEAEDQDICAVAGGTLDCGGTNPTNNRDGKPDTLQELALKIAGRNGPAYDVAYDRNGADDRGIVTAFLYRTDRVELLPADPNDPLLGSNPTVNYRAPGLSYNSDVQNPKALNAALPGDVDTSTGTDGTNVFTRAPQVGLFRVWRSGIGSGSAIDLYVLGNHFSSGPDRRVGQRTEQSAYNAALVAALQAANPQVQVLLGGDLNVFPRPDDPFAPGSPLFPTDQLAPLYNQGLVNLFDTLLAQEPVSAYGYIFQGQTQTLDQVFVTPSLFNRLVDVREAHINSDWPSDFDGDGPRGLSDHDPQIARFALTNQAPTVAFDGRGTCVEGDVASGTARFTITDPDTLPANLTVTATSANQALVPDGNIVSGGGSITVTAVAGQSGTAALTLSVNDGTTTTSAGLTVVVGTSGNDRLNGTTGADLIFGLGGSDKLDGRAGNDLVCGGSGDDQLLGNDGNDTLEGGAGNDTITGGNDADHVLGQGDDDTLDGGSGDDLVDGGTGTDSLKGSDGVDTLTGGDGADTLMGGGSADTLDGGAGTDVLDGNDGNDRLDGGTENDTLRGSNGDDTLMGGAGADRFSGGSGTDTAPDFNAAEGDTQDGTIP